MKKSITVTVTEKQIEKYAEDCAIGQFLSDFPAEKSFSEIIELIESESEDITPWEPFEYTAPEALINLIMEHKEHTVFSLKNFLKTCKG